MGAVLHWIFSCTAMFPDFAAIFKYLYPVVGRFLLVEWIDRFDPAVKSFNHLTCSGSDYREMYTLSKFEQEVQKFANILEKDPTRGPSRILYVLELRVRDRVDKNCTRLIFSHISFSHKFLLWFIFHYLLSTYRSLALARHWGSQK